VETLAAHCAATTFVVTAGPGLAGGRAATAVAAQVGGYPSYHWCIDAADTCHDDGHRDRDGDGGNHHNDFCN
jgi:hypothetical protein